MLPVLTITLPGTSDLAIGLDARVSEGSSLCLVNPFILSHFQFFQSSEGAELASFIAATVNHDSGEVMAGRIVKRARVEPWRVQNANEGALSRGLPIVSMEKRGCTFAKTLNLNPKSEDAPLISALY